MIFIAADQTAVNLKLVTHLSTVKSEGKWILRISFVGGTARELLFNRSSAAAAECNRIIEAMCELDK